MNLQPLAKRLADARLTVECLGMMNRPTDEAERVRYELRYAEARVEFEGAREALEAAIRMERSK